MANKPKITQKPIVDDGISMSNNENGYVIIRWTGLTGLHHSLRMEKNEARRLQHALEVKYHIIAALIPCQ